MKTGKDLMIALIGTADQVTFMRMGGIGAWRIIRQDSTVAEQVRSALNDLLHDPSIGIIILPEEWKRHAGDIIEQVSLLRDTIPVIMDIPAVFDRTQEDIKQFYQSYAKKLIGFGIEI